MVKQFCYYCSHPQAVANSSLRFVVFPPQFPRSLTHWGRVTHICVSKLIIIGSDNGLSPSRRQAIYQNQCWNIVNLTLGNKLQWNLNRNWYIFIQENAFENIVCVTAAILSRPQCVKDLEYVGASPVTSPKKWPTNSWQISSAIMDGVVWEALTYSRQGVQRSGKSQGNSRLGKSQGKVREFCWRSWKKWILGKVREFAFSAI